MKFVKRLLVAGFAMLVILAVIGLFLPSQVQVERAIVVAAPPDKIYPFINDLRKFNEWSPWHRRDPDIAYRFEGPKSGVGSKVHWSSDHPQVGSGSQEIVASEPAKMLKTRLDFGQQGIAHAYFKLVPEAQATRVTWGFTTDFGMNLIGRYMGLMFNQWIGADYEEGLQNLKQLAETQ